jgi:hypothetical protein
MNILLIIPIVKLCVKFLRIVDDLVKDLLEFQTSSVSSITPYLKLAMYFELKSGLKIPRDVFQRSFFIMT